VTTGKTYTLYAVKGPSTGDGVGSKTISPVAAVVDATAPVTTSNALANYVSSASIKLTATDVGTGVANTYYKLDGSVQTLGTAITTSVLGAHTIEFWSVDKAGNTETHKTASFTVTAPVVLDTTPPVTTSNVVASYVSNALITFSATDAGSGVANTYYILDGGLQTIGKSVSVTALGAHTLQFWSVDAAGNAELHKNAAFTITAPVVVDTMPPVTISDAKATYVTSAAIKLTATDAGSGVASTYYILDGGVQTAGTAVSVTATGTHTLEFWSTDVAGNAETHKTVSFTVTDAVVTPPTTGTGHTVKVKIPKVHTRGHVATLTNNLTGEKFTAWVGKDRIATFKNVPAGSYKITVMTKHGTKIIRTVVVKAPVVTPDDDDADDSHNLPRD